MTTQEPQAEVARLAWGGDAMAAHQMIDWVMHALHKGLPMSPSTRQWLAAVLGMVLDADGLASERDALALLGKQRRSRGRPPSIRSQVINMHLEGAVACLARATTKSRAVEAVAAATGTPESAVWAAVRSIGALRVEYGESSLERELLHGYPVLRKVWKAALADHLIYSKELREFLEVTMPR